MQDLIDEGKIRGWGLCNDNAYGLTGCTRSAKALGVTPPCSIQGDFSLIDRKVRSFKLMPPLETWVRLFLSMFFSISFFHCRAKKMVWRKQRRPSTKMVSTLASDYQLYLRLYLVSFCEFFSHSHT